MISKYHIDVIGFLEVTVGSGQAAVTKICSALKAAKKGSYVSITTANQTFPTRTGEYNAVVYREIQFYDNTVKIDTSKSASEELFPQKSSSGRGQIFLNRVPVLFKIPLSAPQKTLQIITWHCPQPAMVNPNQELNALAESINDCIDNHKNGSTDISIDDSQPVIISGDFNFDTDPNITAAWNVYLFLYGGTLQHGAYLKRFTSLLSGAKTTLVKKDPEFIYKPFTPVDFDDLLCNAFDTILIDSTTLALTGQITTPVVNHLQTLVAPNKITFTYQPPGSIYATQLQINNANKISDHCMVIGCYNIK